MVADRPSRSARRARSGVAISLSGSERPIGATPSAPPFAHGQPPAVAAIDLRAARRDEPRRDRGAVEAWDAHRNAPGDIRLPARIAQIIRDRGQAVELVAPDIGLAVAVAVDREPQRDGRHELRIAGRAGPAALQAPARHAPVDQPQRGDELGLEQIAAAAFIAKVASAWSKSKLPVTVP